MANAWPNIKHLFLDPAHSPNSTVTLEGLVPLAKHCRHLTEVGIGLNVNIIHIVYASVMYVHELSMDTVSDTGSTAEGQSSQGGCPVVTLNLGVPWVHDTAACAELLRCIFPSLEELYLPGNEQYDHPSGTMFAWRRVARLVRQLNSTGVTGDVGSMGTPADAAFDGDDNDNYCWDGEESQETSSENSE